MFGRYKGFVLVLCSGIILFCSAAFVDSYFELSRNLDIFSSLFRQVNTVYVDSLDSGKLMQKGIDAMLGSLDPYTTFIPESKADDYRFMTTGLYGGIGATIRAKGDYICVNEPYEGFPAQKNDLRAGDLILELDGKSMKGKKTDEISHLLKGKPGTEVKITIQRAGEKKPLVKTLTREEIKVKSVPYAGILKENIGYIRLTGFTEGAGNAVKEALKTLKQQHELAGVILDLRGNPGGLLNEAVNVSNVFVPKGLEIVSTRGKIKEWSKSYKAINDAEDEKIPLVVLVNSGSASASEIVSGSLQDLDRGVILGQRTFGKGLVQSTRPLSYNTQVKITTAKYYIPSGRCIQALDYSHRNADGSVGKVPDSLMTAFRTQGGRKVFDGGGILPDLSVEARRYSGITTSLLNENLIFDYATTYQVDHPVIAPPIAFRVNAAEFGDFQKFISSREYKYTTASEKELENVKKSAVEEKYFDKIKPEIEALQKRIAANKKEDVTENKDEIIRKLSEEIASRYYFQVGRIEASLQSDPEIEKATEILKAPEWYRSILDGTYKPADEAKSNK